MPYIHITHEVDWQEIAECFMDANDDDLDEFFKSIDANDAVDRILRAMCRDIKRCEEDYREVFHELPEDDKYPLRVMLEN